METKQTKRTQYTNFLFSRSSNPYKLLVVLAMGGSALVFLILTVAYAARSTMPQWNAHTMPSVFFASTFIVMGISIGLHIAYGHFNKEEYQKYAQWVYVCFILSMVFIIMQVLGWGEWWFYRGITLRNSTQGAFIYLLSGLHLFHAFVGIALLGMVLKVAMRNSNYVDGFIASLDPRKKAILKSTILFWHFLDGLWVYLFLFFLLF